MHYLIDGHNLIGRIESISLADPDDEMKLISLLKIWASRSRGRRVTVVFDRGLPGGQKRHLSNGQVKVQFASSRSSADSVLKSRISRAPKPKEITVVSSDRDVVIHAGRQGVATMSSDEFSQLLGPQQANGTSKGEKPDQGRMSPAELDDWLKLFGSNGE